MKKTIKSVNKLYCVVLQCMIATTMFVTFISAFLHHSKWKCAAAAHAS